MATERPERRRQAELAVKVPLDPYLTLRALTKYASLSKRTLRRLIARPVRPLPTFRVGSRILVRVSEFDWWMAEERRAEHRRMDEMVNEVRALVRGAAPPPRAPAAPVAPAPAKRRGRPTDAERRARMETRQREGQLGEPGSVE